MGRLKTKRKQGKNTKPTHVNPPVVNRRALEKSTVDVTRLLQEQEFGSVEEANAFLQGILSAGKPIASTLRTPLAKAQDLMYDAWESSGKRRVALAQKALKISGDCADAYGLLAEETARSLEEAKNLYELGVKAGERALGPKAFEEGVGHFWGILQTRPYMRARAGLAQSLWRLGKHQQAIDHYADMLRLNPNDNQGIRYLLAQGLLEEKADEAFDRLMRQYPHDAAAAWVYTRALWFFRREGEGKKSNACIREALKVNRFVPSYLLGKKKIPQELPEYIGWGDESEAFAYAAEAINLWQETEGALEWLTKSLTGRSS